ncbi:hypothetical protein SLA2020_301660 [Shorea laevis]
MENYQMFFPCSSNMAATNSSPQVINYNGATTTFHGDATPNGLLKLKAESFVQRSDVVKGNQDDHLPRMGGKSAEGNSSGAGKKIKEKKIRKPRYAFQTRSQVDILDDGYRWRKYGQKAVKNNKFPRSYYRCTHQGCNVKKQVQRLTRDESIVETTYEGMHTHPIQRPTDNFEQILSQMQIYSSFGM